MNFFLPKQYVFFDLFKQLNGKLIEIADLLVEFAKQFSDFDGFSARAKEIEHQADDKTHEIIERLNKTFVTPLDREDIYLLAHELDDIIDLIENVINNTRLYQITAKKEVVDIFASLVKAASNSLTNLINILPHKKNSDDFNNEVINIHNFEDQGDFYFQEAMSRLFMEEKDAISMIKWKSIIENLEKIMDKYQGVSDIIRGIIVKSS